MSYWDLQHDDSRIALIDESTKQSFSYLALQENINHLKASFQANNHKKLGFVFCKNNAETIIGYLASLQSKQAAYLLNADLNISLREGLFNTYQPDWVWAPKDTEGLDEYKTVCDLMGYELKFKTNSNSENPELHPDLAVLLSTSGTTGSPKLVRLSFKNIQANAESIATYLKLTSDDRPITTLPPEYSYGLSIINSHLHVGATILLTDNGVMTRNFWDFFKEHQATSLAGVPYTYQMFYRIGLDKMELPSLRTMTEAGGRLKDKFQQYFGEYALKNNINFFIMYGQTEATARMSYVPSESLLQKIGSIGVAIPNGRFEIVEDTQELVYYGPNVMMGYAESREDLARGDEMAGRLETGDLARQDEDGFFYILGRKKRFLKLFGLRINLDDVERTVEQQYGINCYCLGEDDAQLVIAVLNSSITDDIKQYVAGFYKLHPTSIKVVVIDEVPVLSTGKVDYKALEGAIKGD